MSLILRIETPGASPQFIRSRLLHTVVGLNSLGLVTTNEVRDPWCSIFEQGGRYLLVPSKDGFASSQGPLHPQQALAIKDGFSCSIGSTSISFFSTSGSAEALAQTASIVDALVEASDISRLPVLEIALADLKKSICLFPEVRYEIGSDVSSAIYLPLPTIAARHVALTLQPDCQSVRIDALEGLCAISALPVQTHTATLPCSIQLLPSGVTLRIAYP